MRIVVLTGNHLRHNFVAQSLIDSLNVVGVWQQEKFIPSGMTEHLKQRARKEEEYFGKYQKIDGARPLNMEEVKKSNPDLVIVFGTGLLEPYKMINLHLGLSPYYRGSGTNFFPLVNREPEYVGATIHHIDEGIDSGDIICQTVPDIELGDGPHDIGNKTIIKAVELLKQLPDKDLTGVPQKKGGKLYLRKDQTEEAVKKMYHNFETGMIEEYLERKPVPIVEW